MIRYSIIHDKNPREIILLRGTGCLWRKCTFCDYHLDFSSNPKSNLIFNKRQIKKVTGVYQHLEVINSGSFIELGEPTLNELEKLCIKKHIKILHFECHWLYRDQINKWKEKFLKNKIILKIKTGIETFDYEYRENILKKGITEKDPQKISELFDECCLLFGLSGQTIESMIFDIETGIKYFERVCINIFNNNTTNIRADSNVIFNFKKYVMPRYIDNDKVDILLNNTDFGVGAAE